jgi:hypothetical protein
MGGNVRLALLVREVEVDVHLLAGKAYQRREAGSTDLF